MAFDVHSARLQRPAERFPRMRPARGRMVVEPAKALTAAAQQLVGGQFGAGGVVRTNVIHAGDRRLTINAHDRNMLLDALVHQRLRRLAGGDDNAGDAKLSETAQGLRQILLAVDLAHQRLKALALDLVKQRIKQGTAKRIADARDDHAD